MPVFSQWGLHMWSVMQRGRSGEWDGNRLTERWKSCLMEKYLCWSMHGGTAGVWGIGRTCWLCVLKARDMAPKNANTQMPTCEETRGWKQPWLSTECSMINCQHNLGSNQDASIDLCMAHGHTAYWNYLEETYPSEHTIWWTGCFFGALRNSQNIHCFWEYLFCMIAEHFLKNTERV